MKLKITFFAAFLLISLAGIAQTNSIDFQNNTGTNFLANTFNKDNYSCSPVPILTGGYYDVVPNQVTSYNRVFDESGNEMSYCNIGGVTFNDLNSTFSISMSFCINGIYSFSGSKSFVVMLPNGSPAHYQISWYIPNGIAYPFGRVCLGGSTANITITKI